MRIERITLSIIPPSLHRLGRIFLRQGCRSLCSSNSTSTLLVSNFYPDVTVSAAGVRTKYLIDQLSSVKNNHVKFVVAKQNNDDNNDGLGAKGGCPQEIIKDLKDQLNIDVFRLPPNRSDFMNDFCQSNPNVDTIIFDRFYTEEAFSFAFLEAYPCSSTMVLDMQDMHSLRSGRQRIVKAFDKQYNSKGDSVDPFSNMNDVLEHIPSAQDPHLLRELASVHRSDLTLVCSPFELALLQSEYLVSPEKLCLAPFFVDSNLPLQTKKKMVAFSNHDEDDSPTNFVFCGGFKHAPNLDAAQLLIRSLWPKLRRQLPPGSSLHIYGAHCPSELHQAHDPRGSGLYVHGYSPNLDDIFSRKHHDENKRILLAPLRFGAGIKGKVIDAWSFGMPVVTTPIGSEGIVDCKSGKLPFGGSIASTVDDFCEEAVALSMDSTRYQQAQSQGYHLLEKLYDSETNWNRVQKSLNDTRQRLESRRSIDYVRSMLWHHSARSTKYFSKWIELKEREQEKTK